MEIHMKKIIPLAVACAALVSTQAYAEVFNGPFIGVQAGWEQNKLDDPFSIITDESKRSGVQYGVNAGYDMKLTESFVLGVQADLGFTTGSDTRILGTSIARLKPQRSFDFSARAGFLAAPSTLFYVRTGYSNARFKLEETVNAVKNRIAGNSDGWMLGGGLEHAFTDKISGRLEYRRTDLEGEKNNRNQMLVGVAYHF
jgi:outer membrane immunogenic protein